MARINSGIKGLILNALHHRVFLNELEMQRESYTVHTDIYLKKNLPFLSVLDPPEKLTNYLFNIYISNIRYLFASEIISKIMKLNKRIKYAMCGPAVREEESPYLVMNV